MNKFIHTFICTIAVVSCLFQQTAYSFYLQRLNISDLRSSASGVTDTAELSTSGAVIHGAPDGSALIVLPDSLPIPTYLFPEVLVTSSRVPRPVSFDPSTVTVVQRGEMESMNSISLDQVLQRISGIFIKDYGSSSGLKTMSLRGLGSEHALVLLNGLRISSMQNGLVDLGLMPTDEMESVEIVRGGQSASYGADAVAGLVNIVTRPVKVGTTIRALSDMGSFGFRRYLISGETSSGVNGLRLSYGEERSEGDFPFQFHNGSMAWNLKRNNADFLTRHGSIYGELAFSEETNVNVYASTFSSERGVPGVVVGPFGIRRARQSDTDRLVQAVVSTRYSNDLTLGCAVQFHQMYERYRDPKMMIDLGPLDTYFINTDVRIEPHATLAVNDRLTLVIGTELVRASADGNSLSRVATRRQIGSFLTGQVALLKTDGALVNISLFPAVRCDLISSATPTWSPQLGALVGFGTFDIGSLRTITLAVRSNVSRNYRMPTFNELYFNGGGGVGNPTLRPEHSTSFDIGTSLQLLLCGQHYIQTSYFLNSMTDRIIWVAAGAGSVAPKNLRSVRSGGVEVSYRWDLPGEVLSLQSSYTTCASRKVAADYPGDPVVNAQLVYVPQETGSVSAIGTIRPDGSVLNQVSAVVTYSFVGFRYYTEDNVGYVPSYRVVNAAIHTRLSILQLGVVAKLEVKNLFNEEYQIMLGYPMPSRSYGVTVGIEYR